MVVDYKTNRLRLPDVATPLDPYHPQHLVGAMTGHHYPLPAVLVGGGAGTLKGGQHIKYDQRTPMTNLLVTMLNKAGVPMDRLGDSTGLVAGV